MLYNQQNGPKMTGEQIAAYLTRIGHTGAVPLDLAGLSAIHKAHQRAVPFENLDICYNPKRMSAKYEDMYHKAVVVLFLLALPPLTTR